MSAPYPDYQGVEIHNVRLKRIIFDVHTDGPHCVAGCLNDDSFPCEWCDHETGPWYTKYGYCPWCYYESTLARIEGDCSTDFSKLIDCKNNRVDQ
jgi:hypothetical protein